MTGPFDPYYKWLGIPPDEQPPNHYRLLAVRLYEPDADVIESAAAQRMAHVRNYQIGPHAGVSQQILNELATARICLLNPEQRRTYDQELRIRLASRVPVAMPVRPPALPTRAAAAMPAPDDPTPVPLDFVDEGEAHRVLAHKRRSRDHSPAALWVAVSAIALAAVAVTFFVRTARMRQHVIVAPPEVELVEQAAASPSNRKAADDGEAAEKENELPSFPKVVPHPVTLPDPPPSGMDAARNWMRKFRESARGNRKPETKPSPTTPAPASPAPTKPASVPEKPDAKANLRPSASEEEPAKPRDRNRTLAEAVIESIAGRTLERSLAGGGGNGGTGFAEVPSAGALLTGFNVTVTETGDITSIQPVFVGVRGARGSLGARYGTPRGRPIGVVARRGFAVAAVNLQGESAVEGLEVKFARITSTGLDREDAYVSPWIGRRSGGQALTIGGDGLPVVGIYGRAGVVVYSLGLVQVPEE
jgi:hypothetical protein